MTRKVWIQSQAKFSKIKRNTKFLQWLAGSTTSPVAPRIELFRSILSGTKIVAAGMFLNIVTRQDLVQNCQDQIETALLSTEAESGPTPEFQIEFFLVCGKMGVTFLYMILTSSVQYAEILNPKMARITPGPSPTDICYIRYQLWDLLPNKKKIAYYAMQKCFNDNHSAMRLKGVNNPYAMMGQLNSTGTQIQAGKGKTATVFTWLTMLLLLLDSFFTLLYLDSSSPLISVTFPDSQLVNYAISCRRLYDVP
jgi:hypothetical protein